MTMLSAHFARPAVLFTAALAALFGAAPAGRAADQPPPFYVGVSECVFCHENGRDADAPPIVCTCKEAQKWLCADRHQDAYTALDVDRNPRAMQMAKTLWPDVDPRTNGPQHQAECLSCHSVPGVEPPKERNASYPESFRMEDGVGCVACHGAAKAWIDAHGGVDRASWRQQSREDKTKLGMTNVWDPARRVAVCGCCHIGDSKSGRVVTHRTYAAGHPRLSGFEAGCFGDALPRHWQLRAEKSDKIRGLLPPMNGDFEQTKLVVVGAAASLRQSMRLLADEADKANQAHDRLDFAQMDCESCHHDLSVPSWRQQRQPPGKRGRPYAHAWPFALLPLAAPFVDDKAQAQFDTELRAKTTQLDDAFAARPYGDPAAVAVAARALEAWADQTTQMVNKDTVKYDREAALKVLACIGQAPLKDVADCDSARQLVRAFRVVYAEANPGYEKASDPRNKRTTAALQDLDRLLALDLPPEEPLSFSLPRPSTDPRDRARQIKLAECAAARRACYDDAEDALVPRIFATSSKYRPELIRKPFADLMGPPP